MNFNWCDRRVARDGPFVTLVRNETDYLAAIAHCKATLDSAWVGGVGFARCHYVSHPNGDLCCIVAIDVRPDNTLLEVYGLLVHEAVHISQSYFEDIGELRPAREQQAYAVQMIAQELMFEYDRQVTQEVKNGSS
jgi:hypothetical protein